MLKHDYFNKTLTKLNKPILIKLAKCLNPISTKNQFSLKNSVNYLKSILKNKLNCSQIDIDKIVLKTYDWYTITEAFDDDDFKNDWIPNDFKNCDGIDIIFMNLFECNNINKLEDCKEEKRFIFDYICACCYDNTDGNNPYPKSIDYKLKYAE